MAALEQREGPEGGGGILPRSERAGQDADLDQAIRVMQDSELVAETLGEHVFDFFLRNKRAEWQEYRRQVTEYELGRYLPML